MSLVAGTEHDCSNLVVMTVAGDDGAAVEAEMSSTRC